MSDRREFLKSLGIAVPTFAVPAVAEAGPEVMVMTPQEVFEIYVESAVRALPQYIPGVITNRNSVVRMVIESQAFALANVLSELQRRQA